MGDSQALNMYVRKVEGCYWKKLAEIQMLPQKPNCDCFGWQQIGGLPRVCMEDTSLSAIIPKLFAEG